jgi:predicted N-acetyltransferase YhbS
MAKEVPTGAPPPAVREQQPGDEAGIREVVNAAYGVGSAIGTDGTSATGNRGFVAVVGDNAPGTDMSAVTQGRIVGYLGLRPARVGDTDALVMDRVAVVPDEQHKGVATYLVQFVVEVLADSHAVPGILVMDPAPFWSTFGFRPAADVGVTTDDAGPGVQVLSLRPEPLRGEVRLVPSR